MTQVKIEPIPGSQGTRVLLNGQEVPCLRDVYFKHEVNSVPEVKLNVLALEGLELEVEADVEVNILSTGEPVEAHLGARRLYCVPDPNLTQIEKLLPREAAALPDPSQSRRVIARVKQLAHMWGLQRESILHDVEIIASLESQVEFERTERRRLEGELIEARSNAQQLAAALLEESREIRRILEPEMATDLDVPLVPTIAEFASRLRGRIKDLAADLVRARRSVSVCEMRRYQRLSWSEILFRVHSFISGSDDVEIDMESGMRRYEKGNHECFEPNGTKTITIRVNGGARNG